MNSHLTNHQKKKLQLYIHIPFCRNRAKYETAVVVSGSSEAKAEYMDALESEIISASNDLYDYQIQNIYIGGGSPTVMNPDRLGKLIRFLRRELPLAPQAEICIEADPGTIGVPCLTGLNIGGLNRISLKMVSAITKETKALNCPFDINNVQNAILYLDKFQFCNVNLDLMYGLPFQTPGSFKRTLSIATDFDTEHISLYPYPHSNEAETPGKETQKELFLSSREWLSQKGFIPYTIYHFAKAGFISKHHLNRYHGMEYMGLGLSSHSFFDGVSYYNTNDYQEYIRSSQDIEKIAVNIHSFNFNASIYQYLSTRLILSEGFALEDFNAKFQIEWPEFSEQLIQTDLMAALFKQDQGRIFLTEEGMFEYPTLMEHFKASLS